MPTTIVDRSGHSGLLTLNVGDSLLVERDSNTPRGETRVIDHINGINVALGASITVQDHAVVNINGPLGAVVGGEFNIGNTGTLRLTNGLTASVLTNVNFTAAKIGTLILGKLNIGLGDEVNGFAHNDRIVVDQAGASGVTWDQTSGTGGLLTVDGAGGVPLGQIAMTGTFSTSSFDFTRNALGGIVTLHAAAAAAQSDLASHGFLEPAIASPATASLSAARAEPALHGAMPDLAPSTYSIAGFTTFHAHV